MFRRHPILSAVTVAYLVLVGWLTFSPQDLDSRDGPLWQLAIFFERFDATSWLDFNTLEFLANIAMFVPIGLFFLLLVGRRRWWVAVILGVLVTVIIESVQYFLPSRVSDPRDLLSNSLGAFIGVILALVVTWRPRAARLRPAVAAR